MSKRRRVIIGVGAGIAAYKTTNVVRALVKSGFDAWVIPTPASLKMVGEVTWRALSGNPVYSQVDEPKSGVGHIELARDASAILVAPATADLLARIAHGIADDMLSNVILAANCPLLLAPAMHTNMWENAATRENVQILRQRGARFVGPVAGALSSGDQGIGRMAAEDDVISQMLGILDSGTWNDQQVMVSAGGTREPLDPVRFLGNRSSGRFGVEIARQFALQGANVTLLAANIDSALLASLSEKVAVISTPTAAQMHRVALELFPKMQAAVMAAAVADYQPVEFQSQKIKKTMEKGEFSLRLRPTADILADLAAKKHDNQFLAGFAAETGSWDQVVQLGREKARRKGADIIFINQVGESSGFGDVTTRVKAVDQQGREIGQFAGAKTQIAGQIVALIRQQIS
ncbi:bifunctional phosphopantothenoylcysteine decarboxylase/phosphopantothenate--cysteine ligase CoaBC [Varibaculum vaginae]|uniref:bifunctional phosphopantothenoylcysteine decarboxylase/phosphopantothenate--cysteine ligase CoaBC n=1 Tax=Varibaculum vaginae TaxID=2364797 RepID=UPI000F083925|nr:bifunctional phosphopantothenoylcysteine decarboxylase/phosphopantothenate--cysteine ligase CoaBC [Varibaculum vaginae]